MAGIIAASATASLAAGDTLADKSISGFVVNERIVLGTNPTGTSHSWGIAIPSASAAARSALDDKTDAAPAFTPDAAGLYTISVTVNGTTTYYLRIAVESLAITRPIEVLAFTPLADSQVPTPTIGKAFYLSSTQGNVLVEKRTDGTVHVVTVV